MKLIVTDAPAADEVAAIRANLIAFNDPFLGPADHRPLLVVAREDGALRGGLAGETGRGIFRIEVFWVEAADRGRGVGSRLLQAAEAEAGVRGCRIAVVETMSFQARPFYERHGYRLFGTLGGLPGNHVTYYLAKHFEGRAHPG